MRVLKVNKENTKNILSDLLKRSPNNYDQYAGTVQGILDEIKEKGDEALFAYTEKFDKCKLTKDTIQVTEEEIKAAYEKVDDSLVEVIRKSLVNIREYHEKQERNSWFDAKPDGTILGQKMTALASVGVYVPGGKAAEDDSFSFCWRVCTGWKGSISVFCTYEYCTGKGSWSRKNRDGYSSK